MKFSYENEKYLNNILDQSLNDLKYNISNKNREKEYGRINRRLEYNNKENINEPEREVNINNPNNDKLKNDLILNEISLLHSKLNSLDLKLVKNIDEKENKEESSKKKVTIEKTDKKEKTEKKKENEKKSTTRAVKTSKSVERSKSKPKNGKPKIANANKIGIKSKTVKNERKNVVSKKKEKVDSDNENNMKENEKEKDKSNNEEIHGYDWKGIDIITFNDQLDTLILKNKHLENLLHMEKNENLRLNKKIEFCERKIEDDKQLSFKLANVELECKRLAQNLDKVDLIRQNQDRTIYNLQMELDKMRLSQNYYSSNYKSHNYQQNNPIQYQSSYLDKDNNTETRCRQQDKN